ncbi:MAG: hypothetical protein ACI9MB_003639, partial [Verrucomicrobiales bacterium]
GGLYRLFATVRDGKGGAAVGNVPVRVDATIKIAMGAKTKLPFSVYAEASVPPTYIPAGWMGNSEAIDVDPDWAENPKSGKTSMKCSYSAVGDWGGVVWQSPEGDWGDRAGGYDFSGAKKLSFWARGAKGGEVVNFSFGLIAPPKKFTDTAKGSLEGVVLTNQWKRYEIPVAGKDLQRIKTGFSWTVAGNGAPMVFFLDDIQWE